MNTYFFVRVRLRRTQGRRSFIYGPYARIEHAEAIIDSIPEILLEQGLEPSTYNLYIEEKCPQQGEASWTKVHTRTRIAVTKDTMVAQSETVTIEIKQSEKLERTEVYETPIRE